MDETVKWKTVIITLVVAVLLSVFWTWYFVHPRPGEPIEPAVLTGTVTQITRSHSGIVIGGKPLAWGPVACQFEVGKTYTVDWVAPFGAPEIIVAVEGCP